jgi:DNA-binding XRE family transcriptional regulator
MFQNSKAVRTVMTGKLIRGSDRLTTMPGGTDIRGGFGPIVDEMDQTDRGRRMRLAAVRHAANLTQAELAERIGIKQAALSGVENRGDLLLSTLASYLEAVGARDVVITAKLGDRPIELPLPRPAATAGSDTCCCAGASVGRISASRGHSAPSQTPIPSNGISQFAPSKVPRGNEMMCADQPSEQLRLRFQTALNDALAQGLTTVGGTGLGPRTQAAVRSVAAEHPDATAALITEAFDAFEREHGDELRD